MGCLITPVSILHQRFLLYRNAKNYQLFITPQVCFLERLLNDGFDFTLRRIRIVDAIWYLPTYIYQEAELKPVAIYQEAEFNPVYLYTENEAGEFKDDFVVKVPAGLVFNENEMRGKLDAYKLAGTHYKIQVV